MGVWPWLYQDTSPMLGAVISVPFVILGMMLLRARLQFNNMETSIQEDTLKQLK